MYNDYTLLTLHHQRIAESARLYQQQVRCASVASPRVFQRAAQFVGGSCVQLGERLLAYGHDSRNASLLIEHVR